MIKKLWNKYQKLMWYIAQAGNEIGKPMRFYSETALLLLLLDKFGIKISIIQFILIYLGIMIVAIIFGRILAKSGTVKYNTSLNNTHNEEIQKILKKLGKIENGIKQKRQH